MAQLVLDQLAAAQAANEELVAAPGAAKTIELIGVYFSSDTACQFSLQDEDDNVLFAAQVAANSGVLLKGNDNDPLLGRLVANKALEYDTSAAVTSTCIVWYEIRKA